jgi:hypothetical protein
MNARRTSLLLLTASFALTGCDKIKSAFSPSSTGSESGARLAEEKLAKYSAAQDDLANHPFDREVQQYDEVNSAALAASIPGRGAVPMTYYRNPSSPVSPIIFLLTQAQAIQADLGPLDASAAKLLAALNALNPTIKDMNTYIGSHLIDTDGGAKARALDPIYHAQMKDAQAAEAEFSHALSVRKLENDKAKLATMKPDSIEYNVNNTFFATRTAADNLEEAVGDPDPKDAIAAFAASIPAIETANAGLTKALAAASGPAPIDSCKSYNAKTTHLIATGQETAKDPFGKLPHETRLQAFIGEYNGTIPDLNGCLAQIHEH